MNCALLQSYLLCRSVSAPSWHHFTGHLFLRLSNPSPSMFLPVSEDRELGLPTHCFTDFSQGPPHDGHHTDEKMKIWRVKLLARKPGAHCLPDVKPWASSYSLAILRSWAMRTWHFSYIPLGSDCFLNVGVTPNHATLRMQSNPIWKTCSW